jgi:hypothetical protein
MTLHPLYNTDEFREALMKDGKIHFGVTLQEQSPYILGCTAMLLPSVDKYA